MNGTEDQADNGNKNDDGFWGILDGGTRFRTLILLCSGVLLLVMLGQWLVSVLLGAILAAITWPLRNRLVKLLGGRVVLASMVLEFGLVASILAPVFLVLLLAVVQVRDLYASMNTGAWYDTALALLEKARNLPVLSKIGLEPQSLLEKLQGVLPDVATWGFGKAAQFSLGLFQNAAILALMLLCLFYMHLSGDRMVARVRRILPLPEGETARLLDVFRRTSVAILKGNFVIAAIQGLLTGLLFASVGIPSAVFFGVIGALCSLVPSVGSALVWLPAGIILAFTGAMGKAAIVLLCGALVISMVDNLLRPILVGRDTGMHDLLVLLTTLGGIAFFGPLGILFGPLIGALFLALLESHEADLASKSDSGGNEGEAMG